MTIVRDLLIGFMLFGFIVHMNLLIGIVLFGLIIYIRALIAMARKR